jgi:hypothetical protein
VVDFLSPVDLKQNELRQAALARLASAPATPTIGEVYFDTTLGFSREWAGLAWQRVGGESIEVYDAATAPADPTFPYLRVERDGDGDIQGLYVGTVD